jgi:hypothetical protein
VSEFHVPLIVILSVHFAIVLFISLIFLEFLSKIFTHSFQTIRGFFSALLSIMICSLFVTLFGDIGLILSALPLIIVYRAIYAVKWEVSFVFSAFYISFYFLYFKYAIELTPEILI